MIVNDIFSLLFSHDLLSNKSSIQIIPYREEEEMNCNALEKIH